METEKMKPVPAICFLGCGTMAERHARNLKKMYPSMKISFASRDISRAQEYVQRLKGHRAYGSYEEPLSDPGIDIVFIVTPHAYHSELAVAAANAKKDIIVEKPVTRTMEELAAIVKAVGKNNVRFTVAENYHYKPAMRQIREFIDQGYIGKPLVVELTKINHDRVSGWRTDPDMMGGGALLEGGVHWINALRTLAGHPCERVMAAMPVEDYDMSAPFEDTIMVVGQYGPVVGRLLHSWRIPNRLKGVSISKIYGTEGVITFESNGLFALLNGKKKRIRFFNPFSFLGFKSMLLSLVEDYRSGRPWEPSLERIQEEFATIHGAYRSLETHAMENIKSVPGARAAKKVRKKTAGKGKPRK